MQLQSLHWSSGFSEISSFPLPTYLIYFGSIRVLESSLRLHEGQTFFLANLWQLFWLLMRASNVGARTQAWQAKWAVFKMPGFACKRFLTFLPHPFPPPFFYSRHFSRGLWVSFLVVYCETERKRSPRWLLFALIARSSSSNNCLSLSLWRFSWARGTFNKRISDNFAYH